MTRMGLGFSPLSKLGFPSLITNSLIVFPFLVLPVTCWLCMIHIVIGPWPFISSGIPVPACINSMVALADWLQRIFPTNLFSIENTFQCLWNTLDFAVHRIAFRQRII